jgi:hypothetical protein
MKVDVIGDEQDNAVPKKAIALGRRMVERKITQAQLVLAFCPSCPSTPLHRETLGNK